MSNYTLYNFTPKTLYALIVYGSGSDKAPSIYIRFMLAQHESGNINILYTEI